MIHNLTERATLYDDRQEAAQGTLHDMIVLALTWDEGRFATARIETVTQEVYGPDGIEEIAEIEDIEASEDEGHPS